jgi:hypothetical protein
MKYKITDHKTHKRYFCERGEYCYCDQLDVVDGEYCMYCSQIIMKVARRENVSEERIFMSDRVLGNFITI